MSIMWRMALLCLFMGQVAFAQGLQRFDDLDTYVIKHIGVERSLGIYVPRSIAAGRPSPVIVALHGRFSSAKALHALSQLQDVAEVRGAILVYPETVGAFWDDGGHSVLPRGEPASDDMGFIKAALASVMAEYAVDRGRVFVVGYDSGGAMAYRLACQPPVPLAGVAVVSALMWQFNVKACATGVPPVSMLIVHGRDNEFFPAAASAARLGAGDTLNFWRKVNGCTGQPSARAGGDSALFLSCQSGTAVAYAGVPDGSRDWFRTGTGYKLNTHEVNAAGAIDNFFFDRARFVLPSGRESKARPRDYLVYVPGRYDAKQPTPIVVMLHGRPSSATEMARISEMNATANRHGFIVVYPEGLNNEWNAQFDLFGKSSNSVRGGGKERPPVLQDDVGFLKTLMDDLGVDLNIDAQRMYVAGFSNGGFMTLRMACSASDVFAAFAEVGSTLHSVMTEFCKGGRPAPMLFMHGTADPSVSIDGVQIRDPQSGSVVRVTLSVKNTVMYFAQRNGCDLSGTNTEYAEGGRSPGTHVIRFVPRNCPPGSAIELYLIDGGGHQWPGVRGVLDEVRFGRVNMDIHASEKIWEFFAAQRLGR